MRKFFHSREGYFAQRNQFDQLFLACITLLLLSTQSAFGQYGSPVTVSRWVNADFDLYDVAIGPQFNGKVEVEVTPVAITLPVWACGEPGKVQPWNDILGWTWQNGGVDWFIVSYGVNKLVYDFTSGDGSSTLFTYSLGTMDLKPFYSDIVSGVLDRGPTERSLDIPWSIPVEVYGVNVGEVSFSAIVKYNVFIEDGRSIYLDQNAKVRSLNIGIGSSFLVDDEHFLTVDDVVNNSGAIKKLGPGLWMWDVPVNNSGTLEIYDGVMENAGGGDFREGTVSLNDGAILRLNSLVNFYEDNKFNGLGTVYVPVGGHLDLASGATVHGSAPLVINGGQLSGHGEDSIFASDTNLQFLSGSVGGVAFAGSIDWFGGSVKGTVFNTGNDFEIIGPGEKRIEASSTLTNTGKLRQTGDSSLAMCGFHGAWGPWPSLIDNKYGATYDLSGDGDIVMGVAYTVDGPMPASPAYNVISNQGTFRKSAGTGESVIEGEFRNNGLLDVRSGILTFKGGGRLTDSSVIVSEGSSLRFDSTFNVDGDNTFQGLGTVYLASNGALRLGSGTTVHGSGPVVINGGQLSGHGLDSFFASDTDVQLLSGSVGGEAGVAVSGSFDWLGGSVKGTLFNTGSDFMISGPDEKRIEPSSTLSNMSTIHQDGDSVLTMCGFRLAPGSWPSFIDNKEGATYDLSGDGDIVLGVVETRDGPVWASAANNHIRNEGTFRKSSGTGESLIEVRFGNAGTVEVTSGTLAFTGGFTQTAGLTSLNGGTISSTSPFNILGGTVEGTGEIVANILNQAGLLSPGFSPGTLTIDGDYTQGPNGRLLMEIAGWQPGQYDVLNITGTAYLDGLLEIKLMDSFLPQVGDTFEIINFGSYTGAFSSVTGLNLGGGRYFELHYFQDGISLKAEVIPAPSALILASIGLGCVTWISRHRKL